jgi:hypothetical protein
MTSITSMNFPRISFNHNDVQIILNPTNAYWISSTIPKGSDIIVVIYNIKYIRDHMIHESNIPYYLSNGYTNHFRANLLLPFYSFNLNSDNSCPQTDRYGNGVLLKTTLITNIDMKDFNRHIIKKLGDHIYGELKDLTKTNEIIKGMQDRSNLNTIDLFSVLSRVGNLLDYLISINSEMLKNTTIRENNFRPVIINSRDDKFNMYNPMVINNSIDSTGKNISNYPNGAIIRKEDDIFRKYLIDSLRYQLNKFIELNLIEVSMVELSIIQSTDLEFNDWVHLCQDKNIDTNKIINYDTYANISRELGINFKLKLEGLIKSGTIDHNNLSFANAYLHNFLAVPRIISVEENIKGWNASCKKKYLKYKMKYLNLKKSLKNN